MTVFITVQKQGGAHRDPLAGLQSELHWELEDDGSIRSHLPLHLPVPQVLILMVELSIDYLIF